MFLKTLIALMLQPLNFLNSFPFGWLFLPVDLIGRPFSQKTRDHFLPLLTSTQWWSETQLALRKVFMMDRDFKERMFAKQIAVMKGQAWNVVETLKTEDHGPLELTRRAKVCVWDDLVNIPVAVPMRAASEEMKRKAESEFRRPKAGGDQSALAILDLGEMDIAGAVPSSSTAKGSKMPPADDLLGIATPPGDLPHPGRFEIATPTTEGPQSPNGSLFNFDHNASEYPNSPDKKSSTLRPSLQEQSRSLNLYHPDRTGGASSGKRERRYSFTAATGRRRSSSIAQHLYGEPSEEDDLEGDLGYAAAEGMEGQQRQVIVERLEPVKGRNPVFSWC